MCRYRLEIDRSLCSGYGICEAVAPDAIELADDGVARLRTAELGREEALEAVASCPTGAITAVELPSAA